MVWYCSYWIRSLEMCFSCLSRMIWTMTSMSCCRNLSHVVSGQFFTHCCSISSCCGLVWLADAVNSPLDRCNLRFCVARHCTLWPTKIYNVVHFQQSTAAGLWQWKCSCYCLLLESYCAVKNWILQKEKEKCCQIFVPLVWIK